MGNTEKTYSRVTEAEEIIKKLCEKQPDVLWCVRPDMVAVLGIENKQRPEKNKVLAKIKPVKGCEKAILQINNIPIRYVIELFYSDWNEWKERKRQWILFHELLHIHSEVGKTIKHDIADFKILVDKAGVNWVDSDKLPDLVNDDVKFDLELRPSLVDISDEEADNIEDDEINKARKNEKKAREESSKKDDDNDEDENDENDENDEEDVNDDEKGPF
jgi:predicted metallopeptidase